jgi:tetratricopeptide (TPR) repeat protein
MNRILFLAAVLGFFACGDGSNTDKMPKEERLALIREMESTAYAQSGEINTTSILTLSKLYAQYADENPEDQLSAGFLFKAGDICMGMEKSELAIQHYNSIIDRYPDYEKVPYCYFLKGFIYENNVKDLEKAKMSYELFIEKYPNHDMTEAAEFSLRNLGKSPEDLIREFESKESVNQEES